MIGLHKIRKRPCSLQGEAQRLKTQFSPALDVSSMAPPPPAAACEISSYGNVQMERRPCSGVSHSHSNGMLTVGGATVTTSAHSRLSSQAGDRNSGSKVEEDDIASAVFGSHISSNRRLGFSQQESRASLVNSPSQRFCSIWGLFGPRTSIPGLSGVRFAVDIVQQHRWVLAVAMEGKTKWLDEHGIVVARRGGSTVCTGCWLSCMFAHSLRHCLLRVFSQDPFFPVCYRSSDLCYMLVTHPFVFFPLSTCQ